jgi:hypothetical protein
MHTRQQVGGVRVIQRVHVMPLSSQIWLFSVSLDVQSCPHLHCVAHVGVWL